MIGTTGCIHYVFDTQALETGEVCEGCFYIVSNGGEITIPYRVKVCAPFCDSSMGPMNDLDQFASLARDNWSEALKIFKTPEFGRVFCIIRRIDGFMRHLLRAVICHWQWKNFCVQ